MGLREEGDIGDVWQEYKVRDPKHNGTNNEAGLTTFPVLGRGRSISALSVCPIPTPRQVGYLPRAGFTPVG
jgi:hypothetical protein